MEGFCLYGGEEGVCGDPVGAAYEEGGVVDVEVECCAARDGGIGELRKRILDEEDSADTYALAGGVEGARGGSGVFTSFERESDGVKILGAMLVRVP